MSHAGKYSRILWGMTLGVHERILYHQMRVLAFNPEIDHYSIHW